VVVPAALAGERLDRAVAFLSDRPRSDVARLVESEGIRVGGKVEPRRSRRLAEGDLVEFDLGRLPVRSAVSTPAAPGTVPFTIVHEDEDFLIVDKPTGVVTHPGAGQLDGTLVNGLLSSYPELADLPAAGFGSAERPGIVHRLDKETSGLLVVARSPNGFLSLSAEIAERRLGRTYRALVDGLVTPEQGIVDAPIGRSKNDPTRMSVAVDGRSARTHYEVLRRYGQPVSATELEVRLETGRTHQIRVHLGAIGHPVLGDSRYGGRRGSAGVSRLMLHAEKLTLTHPRTAEPMKFAAPLPAEFREGLERFTLLDNETWQR
jgi:23S rRNA pseudouridine1911/1915/1917 synthase